METTNVDRVEKLSTQVSAKRRRRFSGAYKSKILSLADKCVKPGEIGALLRKEGLYSSHLAQWRTDREKGGLTALEGKKRGRKPNVEDTRNKQILDLQSRLNKSEARAERAEALIELQKKIALLLGTPINDGTP